MSTRFFHTSLVVCLVVSAWQISLTACAGDSEGRWKRIISYQDKNDLFANYQVGPHPCGTAAQMYISPQPVPAHVGHTYTSYQPLMPHEYMYKHTRSHYAHVPGSGWNRSKVRYRTFGLRLQDVFHNLNDRY